MEANENLNSLVLLAGFSRRMGQLKQHTKLFDHTFLEIILQKLELNRKYLQNMLFVGQASDKRSQSLVANHGGIWFNNPSPDDGPLSSINIALKGTEPAALLLWPVDHPMIYAETVTAIIEEWREKPELITVPSDGERRGHPSIFPAWCREEFFKTELSEGAKKVLQNWPDRINHLVTDDPWIRKNINDANALAGARAAFAGSSANFAGI